MGWTGRAELAVLDDPHAWALVGAAYPLKVNDADGSDPVNVCS